MEKKNEKNLDRREFLKLAGLGLAYAGLFEGCNFLNEEKKETVKQTPLGEMTHRLSSAGDKISLLGYGMMRLPTIEGSDTEIDQDMVNHLVDYALEHGVNYFDTAPPYMKGKSEEATGIALSRHPRDSYFLATKLSNHWIARETSNPQEIYEKSLAMYKESFKNLRTDHIDYYLMHNVGGDTGIPFLHQRFFDNGLLDFLVKEREAGRIRHLGFSFHGKVEVFDYLLSLHDKYHWDFVQIQLNWLDWKHAEDRESRIQNVNAEYLYGELEKRDISAIIMEPLLGGRLSNVHDHVVEMLKKRDVNASVASWAFRFAGSFPKVLTVLSGMTYMEHLKDNLHTYSPLKKLSEDEFRFLADAADLMTKYPTVACNDCKYCMPCPYGIDIPNIFVHYNKCVNEGRVSHSPQDAHYAQARKEFLVGYDRSVPKLRQANHCIACNQCVPKCPQAIDIPKTLQRIDAYVENLKRHA